MFEFMTVRELYEMVMSGAEFETESLEYVELDGWVRTNRDNGKVGFLALNDGTYFRNCQIVYLKETLEDYDTIKHISTGSAIRVLGKFKLTPESKQPFEIEATQIVVEGACDDDFPLQKKIPHFVHIREIVNSNPQEEQ